MVAQTLSSQATHTSPLVDAAITELQAFESQILDFKEHVSLAMQMMDDPRIKAFLTHALDEEAERLEKLKQLKQQWQTLGSELPETTFKKTATTPNAEASGHFRLRDGVNLTVGSLLGNKQ